MPTGQPSDAAPWRVLIVTQLYFSSEGPPQAASAFLPPHLHGAFEEEVEGDEAAPMPMDEGPTGGRAPDGPQMRQVWHGHHEPPGLQVSS